MSALNELTITGALRALQHAAPSSMLAKTGKRGGKGARANQADTSEEGGASEAVAIPDAPTHATQVLRNLNATLRRNRLPDSSDALASTCEAVVALLFSSPVMPGLSCCVALFYNKLE